MPYKYCQKLQPPKWGARALPTDDRRQTDGRATAYSECVATGKEYDEYVRYVDTCGEVMTSKCGVDATATSRTCQRHRPHAIQCTRGLY